MGYMVLTAIGAGVAGMTAANAIQNERGGMALATGAGLWLGLSAVIALFFGSYYTLRISKFVTNKIGAAHGFVVASIFFILLGMGATSSLGTLSRGVGQITQNLGAGVVALSSNTAVQDAINRAIGTANLKSEPADVVAGLATRLMRGDVNSARDYFQYQTGGFDAESNARFDQLRADFDIAARNAGIAASRAVADAGWSLFVTFTVGLIAALFGGRMGAQANANRPLAAEDTSPYLTHAIGQV
jgi:hypothetical protein